MSKKILKHRKAFSLIPMLGLMSFASVMPYQAFGQSQPPQNGAASDVKMVKGSDLQKKDSIASAIASFLDVERKTRNLESDDSNSLRFLNDQENPELEDLVLAVFLDKKRLSAGMFTVQDDGRYYLPFSALSEIFGFQYEMNLSEGYADGWALEEKNNYSIDSAKKILRYKGKKFDLPTNAVLDSDVTGDDLYVLIDVLEQIWPLRLNVTLNNLILRVIPDDKLPFQLALERNERRDKVGIVQERLNKPDKVFPFIAYPYQSFSKPTLDITTTAGFDRNKNKPTGSLNVKGVNDLAYASADYSGNISFLGGEVREPESIRFRLTRENIHEGALPYGLERVRAGDVRLPNRELISTDTIGRGVTLTNEKKNKIGDFDRVTIDGTGIVGWEVELYRNDQLLEFSTVDERGEYRFEDISVGYGNNRFRIVLYGPQGQIRERVENYLYQSNMVKKGGSVFSAGVIDANEYLIPIDERDDFRARGLTANVYGAYGLGSNLTVFGTANRVRDRVGDDTVSREYLSTGLIGSIGSTLLQLEGYKELDGGKAVDLRGVSTFKGFNLNSQVSVFDDFESPSAQSGLNAKKLETDFRLRRNFSTALGALGLEVNHNYRKRESGVNNQRLFTRQSLGIKGHRITNTTNSNFTNNSHRLTTGRVGTSKRQNGWTFRNFLNYKVFPDVDLTSVQTNLRYGRDRSYKTGVTGSYNFINEEKRLGVQISRDFKKFLGSAEADWSSKNGVGFLLRTSTAMGPFGNDGSYRYRSLPLTNVGPIKSFIYNDGNYTDSYDGDDTPVENAKIVLDRRHTKKKTSKSGTIIEVVSDKKGNTNVKVARDSIEDPYLIPSVAGYSMHPRPGVLHELEFPLIETGAIDGTLRWSPRGKGIPGVTLQLLGGDLEVVQVTRTAPDGYYTFERVPPGQYTIRPAPEDGVDIPFQYVNLTPDNLFQFGTDISGGGQPRAEGAEDGEGGIDFSQSAEVQKDGTLSVKNILSLAKGYKEKRGGMVHKAALSNSSVNKAAVTSVRVGKHPNKVRLVMDLTQPVQYSIDSDSGNNMIYIKMPNGSWAAGSNSEVINSYIASGYNVEQDGQGIKLGINVANGARVVESGLLKANGPQNDRLFIDIQK